jgi:predicted nuclease with TOPRIM domain
MTKQDQIEKLKDDVFELRQELLVENRCLSAALDLNKELKEEVQQLRLQLSRIENEKREQEKKFYNAFSEYLKHYKRIRISTGIELPNPFNVSDIDPTEYAAHIVNKEEA